MSTSTPAHDAGERHGERRGGVPDVAVFSTQSHVSQFARGEQLDEELVID